MVPVASICEHAQSARTTFSPAWLGKRRTVGPTQLRERPWCNLTTKEAVVVRSDASGALNTKPGNPLPFV
jgi:hypothetical protein